MGWDPDRQMTQNTGYRQSQCVQSQSMKRRQCRAQKVMRKWSWTLWKERNPTLAAKWEELVFTRWGRWKRGTFDQMGEKTWSQLEWKFILRLWRIFTITGTDVLYPRVYRTPLVKNFKRITHSWYWNFYLLVSGVLIGLLINRIVSLIPTYTCICSSLTILT